MNYWPDASEPHDPWREDRERRAREEEEEQLRQINDAAQRCRAAYDAAEREWREESRSIARQAMPKTQRSRARRTAWDKRNASVIAAQKRFREETSGHGVVPHLSAASTPAREPMRRQKSPSEWRRPEGTRAQRKVR